MISKKINITAAIAVLWSFCFVTALSADITTGLRGSDRDINTEGERSLAAGKISAYRCDAENRKITSVISNRTDELEDAGLDVRICFQTTRQAAADSLYLLKIDDFGFTKDRTNGDLAAAGPTRQIPVIMRQEAVDHGVPLSSTLTEIFCEPGSEVCAIETRLTGYFFLTSGIIRGKGSIMMQRGDDERRILQDMAGFEDVYLELKFTGGGRTSIPPKQRWIIIIGIIIGLLLLCCCCGIFCCMAGICCFAARKKDNEETEEDDNIEEVSVKIEWAENAKNSKMGTDDEDKSETESLEDDKYWDDEIDASEEGDTSEGEESVEGNESDDNSDENLDSEENTKEVIDESEEETPRKKKSNKKIGRID